ncbi:hypothetical protein CHS0354_030067 [Potamilus streckersoni]|uniref:Uncharacterized protein n=1 Tax=Potamilus streckersoni TaxID=2493646 RepID=A0AAE0RLT7_9BIVA|nr:hypothetical protein CHS0354_030067 [Potamilus streckersoni]
MGDIKLTKSDLSSALSKLKDPDTAFPVEIVDSNRAKTLTFTYSPGNIWDWKDLQAMNRNLSTTYTLKNDITLPNAGTDGMTSAGFEPVGTSAAPFTGTFNGNGPTADNAGLFGYVNGASASIRNGIIELPAGNRDVISAKKYAGTWAGQIHNKAVIDNAGVISADNTGTNTSKIISSSTGGAAGGLVGIAKDSTVRGYFKAGKGTVIESPNAVADSESGSADWRAISSEAK